MAPDLEALRRHSAVPIIAIDSQPDEMTLLHALEGGADDYVSWPISHLVLIARMRAVMRRARPSDDVDFEPDLTCGPLCVSELRHRATFRACRCA